MSKIKERIYKVVEDEGSWGQIVDALEIAVEALDHVSMPNSVHLNNSSRMDIAKKALDMIASKLEG